jgi:hypothetical protein
MTQRRIRGSAVVRKSRVVVVRPPQVPVVQRCPVCRRKVEMVIPEEAARRAEVSTRTMYRWVDAGRVHFVELADGEVLVCLNSIETTWRSS